MAGIFRQGMLHAIWAFNVVFIPSGIGGSAPLDSQKFAKNQEKEGKIRENREKEEKSGRKGNNQEGSFTLPLLRERERGLAATLLI